MTIKSQPTIDDVARAAAVSTATVSRCLNTPAKVSQATRDRVMGAVKQLGYTPNFAARAMAANRTHTIGAIIPTMDNAIFARGIQAFQETLHQQGYTLLVASSAYDPVREADQIDTLIGRGADGLLLIGYDRAPDVYKALSARGVPTLLSWAHQPQGPLPAVGFDNEAAMRALADHMLDMGHRDIGVISGHVAGNDRAADRLKGIRAALSARGLSPVAVVECNYGIETGAQAFAQIMADPSRPTLVMCGNDVLAVGALQQARLMGLQVPRDVSVTGFDDIELASIATPDLTTVHVPHRDMGIKAAHALIAMIETGQEPPSIKLDSTIRLRGSVRRLS